MRPTSLLALAASAILVPMLAVQSIAPLEPLGDDPYWGDVAPVWSPDGERIAFASSHAGALEVFTVRSDGSDPVQLTDLGSVSHPSSWSPDGSEILIESEVSGDRELYAISADGATLRRLTFRDGRDSHPAWMPDGSRIVFYSDRDGAGDIYSMDAGGGDVLRLTSDPAVDVSPVPSPDGTRIAFGSERTGDREIFVMSADGGKATRLTVSPGFDGWPRWSPDGTRIAFTSERDGDNEIYVMNADGTAPRRLTTTPGLDYQQDWAPDGRSLVYRSNDGGRAGLALVALADGSTQRLTNRRLSHFARVARAEGTEEALRRLAGSPGGPSYFHEREILHLALVESADRALATRLLAQGVAAYPRSAILLVALGDAHLALGDKSAAVAAFERTVRLEGEGAVERLRQARAD